MSLIAGAGVRAGTARERGGQGPSFDCSRATSTVNQMICRSTELSALDAKLARDYDATRLQAGIDAQTLQADEARWLTSVRNGCTDVPCIRNAYEARDEFILDEGLRAASPAAYEDTRPFAAAPPAASRARHLIGTDCGSAPAEPLPGTATIAGFHPVSARVGYVVPLAVDGSPFAFLLATTAEEGRRKCVVRGAVALPAPVRGVRFLQCHLGEDSHGVAVRTARGETLAYWSITADGALRREPIHVIGETDLRCREPETGE